MFRPDADPRIPHNPPVCDGDRTLMDRHLGDIARLDAELRNDEGPIVDDRQYERFGRDGAPLGTAWADPLTTLGGVAPINSPSKQPSVSGSRERSIPIRVDHLDLQARAKVPSLAPSSRGKNDTTNAGWPEDQIGHISAAARLYLWAQDVRETLFSDHSPPPATVAELVGWLRNRLDDICGRHPAVDEMAAEMRDLRGALRAAAGETEAKPEPCEGIACRRCDLMTLYRQPGGDVTCVNPDCQAVLRDDEYRDWVKTLVAEVRIKRHADQNA